MPHTREAVASVRHAGVKLYCPLWTLFTSGRAWRVVFDRSIYGPHWRRHSR